MNKVITTAAVILCLAGSANAGDAKTSHGRSSGMASTAHTVLVGVDVDAALPLGTYGDINGFGGGALLTIEYPVIEQLSLTGRAGFQFHTDKSQTIFGTSVDSHVHSVPVLLGAKYYVMETNRLGYQWNQWSARLNLHSHDLGNLGDAVMVTGGVGYQFAGF